jgi:hypothetical protein
VKTLRSWGGWSFGEAQGAIDRRGKVSLDWIAPATYIKSHRLPGGTTGGPKTQQECRATNRVRSSVTRTERGSRHRAAIQFAGLGEDTARPCAWTAGNEEEEE